MHTQKSFCKPRPGASSTSTNMPFFQSECLRGPGMPEHVETFARLEKWKKIYSPQDFGFWVFVKRFATRRPHRHVQTNAPLNKMKKTKLYSQQVSGFWVLIKRFAIRGSPRHKSHPTRPSAGPPRTPGPATLPPCQTLSRDPPSLPDRPLSHLARLPAGTPQASQTGLSPSLPDPDTPSRAPPGLPDRPLSIPARPPHTQQGPPRLPRPPPSLMRVFLSLTHKP